MKTCSAVIKILILLVPLVAWGRRPSSAQDESTQSVQQMSTHEKSERTKHIIRRRSSFRLLATLGNERIAAKRDSTVAGINMQFYGYGLNYTYSRPFRGSHWRHTYGLSVFSGLAKGQGRETGILDEVRNQPFILTYFTPALSYRPFEQSEFAIGIPLAYRFVFWQLNKSSGLKLDRDQSYSYGPSLTYINYFSKRAQLIAEVNHQLLWNDTFWSIGLGYLF